MSRTRHTNGEDYQPATVVGSTHEAFFARRRKAISARLDKAKAALATLEKKLTQLCLNYALLADVYEVPAIPAPDGSPIPTEFPEHRRSFHFYRGAEWASYFASAVLLSLLTFLNFVFPWEWKVLIVATVFVVIWKLLPALLAAAFNVRTSEPESIQPIKRTLLIGGVVALGGLVGFSLTRASDEAIGFTAMVYQNSLTVAELGFALCAASLNILKQFYGWSHTAARTYDEYTEAADDLRAEVAELSARLSALHPGVMNPPAEGDENHVN